jgi:hypothetical protein
MKMVASSQFALLVFAGIFVVLGGMIGSPDGRLLALSIAGLLALILLLRGSSRILRILALLILAAVVLQAIPAWRQHRSLSDRYRVSPRINSSVGTQ